MNGYGYQQQTWMPQRQQQDFNFQMPMQQPQYQQPMQYQAPQPAYQPEPVQQMPQAMPVTLQSVVDMMGQMLQELAAIREAMRRE